VSGDLSGGTLPPVSSDPDAPERTAGEEPAADPFAPENFGPSIPLDLEAPASPFTDSAGNEWPTADPFAKRDVPNDPPF
jgi:hypothetical protein